MSIPQRRSGPGRAAGEAERPFGRLDWSGGRRQRQPLRQQKLPGYEKSDADIWHRGAAAHRKYNPDESVPVSGAWWWFFVFAQTIWSLHFLRLQGPAVRAGRCSRIQNSLR